MWLYCTDVWTNESVNGFLCGSYRGVHRLHSGLVERVPQALAPRNDSSLHATTLSCTQRLGALDIVRQPAKIFRPLNKQRMFKPWLACGSLCYTENAALSLSMRTPTVTWHAASCPSCIRLQQQSPAEKTVSRASYLQNARALRHTLNHVSSFHTSRSCNMLIEA